MWSAASNGGRCCQAPPTRLDAERKQAKCRSYSLGDAFFLTVPPTHTIKALCSQDKEEQVQRWRGAGEVKSGKALLLVNLLRPYGGFLGSASPLPPLPVHPISPFTHMVSRIETALFLSTLSALSSIIHPHPHSLGRGRFIGLVAADGRRIGHIG